LSDVLESLRHAATELGFLAAHVTAAAPSSEFQHLQQWIEAGYCGTMDYFAKRLDAYADPQQVLPGVRSIMVLLFPYDASERPQLKPGHGRIARYVGEGPDYHDRIHVKLKQLAQVIRKHDRSAGVRGVVDTAPLLERELASLAGLGWRGKNTLLLNKTWGSYFFLACLLTTLELTLSEPFETSHCGSCTACLDACPTQAFPQPGVLDASRCISYLTIEHDGPIALEFRGAMSDWIFGCDVCQDVCPWNRKPSRNALPTANQLDSLELTSLFDLNDDTFRERFRKTPLWRSARKGLLRNAAIALGNLKKKDAIPSLIQALNDGEPVVRGAAAWAIGNIGSRSVLADLYNRQVIETDTEVQQEIIFAIEQINGNRAR
jgi:epoxyqueuosine reductase